MMDNCQFIQYYFHATNNLLFECLACSPTGEGLHEALDWLCSTTKNVVRNRAAASSSWW